MAEEIKEFTEMTKAGYNEKVKELNFRKNEERNRISEQIKYAKSLGDFSENAELDAAKDKDNDNERRIAELEYEIATAKIIESRTFIVYDPDEEPGERYYKCELVGDSEASVINHKISKQSPFGKALLSHGKGATFKVNDFEYKIIEDNEKKIVDEDIEKLNAKDI